MLNRLIVFLMSMACAGVLLGCTTIIRPESGTTTTIILTRHGDRDYFSKVLNEKGVLRAKALQEAVGNMNIVAIYSPDLKRNKETVRPLAKHLGIKITVVSSSPDPVEVINTFFAKHAGETVLWVGNTSNLDDIYSLLKGDGDPPVTYGDLFIMKISDKERPEIIKSRYGP